MPKYSVKKPMTVFVAVIIIIALGIVSLLGMTPDLMPSIDLPYVVVMTTYPGATPEEVEETVTKPLEQGLATTENLKNIQSISAANYSLIVMEFENGSNMDTAAVNILQSADIVEGTWDESIGSPYIMKINPSMMPIAIAAADMDGFDTEELSTFVKDTLIPELEGTTGVASINTGGLIESKINVTINEEKIESLNEKLLSKANGTLADAKSKINSGLNEVKKAEAKLAKAEAELNNTKKGTYDKLSQASAELDAAVAQASVFPAQFAAVEAQKKALEARLKENPEDEIAQMEIEALDVVMDSLKDERKAADAQVAQLKKAYKEAEKGSYTAKDSLDDAAAKIDAGQAKLSEQKAKLESAMEEVNASGNEALKKADLGTMIDMKMVSGVLQGQNFSMPAGYIQENDVKYLVSVGDKMTNLEDVKNQFLFNVEGIGDVHLNDVADVFVSDNSDSVYASINGNAGVLLTFSKQSNYPTATVASNIEEQFDKLSEKHEGLKFTTLMNQGDYIYLIIGAIGESLGYGALFAILILLLFLRDIKPTIITLLSIPISIMFAIVLMYFSGVTLNMISLSGLAVAVGMLVDNSIVVIENIFRLRREGVPPKKAAVAGAKQVSAAIASSTLTTICVFAPIVFVKGITRQLFTDMALTITYSLLASLVIALTLVPAMSSMMLQKNIRPEGSRFNSFKEKYKSLLSWNLKHRAVVIIAAVGLLVFSIVASVARGFIFIPDMATPELSGTMTMKDEDAKIEETKAMADRVIAAAEEVEGVETVGAMLSTGNSLMGETSNSMVSLYIIVDEETDRSGGEICKDIESKCKDLDCTVEMLSSTSMTSYTSALGDSGVVVDVFGNDTRTLQKAAEEIGKKLETVEGIKTVNDGLEETEPEIHFAVDKEKAMRKGLTVAQVYMQVSEAITAETTSTTLTWGADDYDIVVNDEEAKNITIDKLKNLELKGTDQSGAEVKTKLSEVAEISNVRTLPSITREGQRTYIAVTGEIDDQHNITLVTEDAQKALKDYDPPEGVTFEFSGENEMIMDAMKDMIKMMALGILLVYLIMVAQFQSLRSPFIVMFTIPLAFTGGLLALLIFGKEISIIAMIGLIMLVGIIVNNGIVLVDYINQLRAGGMEKTEAILEGGATRMRPVLMTSLTTILGLIVMAIGKTAGTDMMQPIALVCIGGLAYATVLTLLLVPVIYDIFTGKEFKVTKEEDVDVSDLLIE